MLYINNKQHMNDETENKINVSVDYNSDNNLSEISQNDNKEAKTLIKKVGLLRCWNNQTTKWMLQFS